LQATKETFRRLQSLAVVRSETRALRIRPPPALESPKTIVADAKTRNAALRATRLAALEIEEAFERRGRAAAIGLPLTRIEQDDARASGSDLIRTETFGSATRRRTRGPALRLGSLASGRCRRLGRSDLFARPSRP